MGVACPVDCEIVTLATPELQESDAVPPPLDASPESSQPLSTFAAAARPIAKKLHAAPSGTPRRSLALSSKGSARLQFQVTRGSQLLLSELAQAIRAIVAAGAPRYSVPSYKYVCPRTAASLERLKAALDRAWS
jgi:hypothetical protein